MTHILSTEVNNHDPKKIRTIIYLLEMGWEIDIKGHDYQRNHIPTKRIKMKDWVYGLYKQDDLHSNQAHV